MNLFVRKVAIKLARAREHGTFISKIPLKKIRNLNVATSICREAERQIMWDPIGFKAGATNKSVWKKLKVPKPFFSFLYNEKTAKSGSKVTFQNNLLGAELEVAFKIKNEVFFTKNKITKKNVSRFIIGIAPALEIVGFRQKINNIDCLGRMISDFGLNVYFITGKIIKYSFKKINNIRTQIINKKNNKIFIGNTKLVLGNPLNSLIWLLNEIKKNKIYLSFDFWVTSGSTTPIVKLKCGDDIEGAIPGLGKVTAKFI